mmetsp:Transcript_105104/g.272188  ORF Transcript_105104/g.272188 Transcript_105104/m.272188 type:complete len:227 (+) Transcript_105104:509-1189(+)
MSESVRLALPRDPLCSKVPPVEPTGVASGVLSTARWPDSSCNGRGSCRGLWRPLHGDAARRTLAVSCCPPLPASASLSPSRAAATARGTVRRAFGLSFCEAFRTPLPPPRPLPVRENGRRLAAHSPSLSAQRLPPLGSGMVVAAATHRRAADPLIFRGDATPPLAAGWHERHQRAKAGASGWLAARQAVVWPPPRRNPASAAFSKRATRPSTLPVSTLIGRCQQQR